MVEQENVREANFGGRNLEITKKKKKKTACIAPKKF